jgi:hypothetical protein
MILFERESYVHFSQDTSSELKVFRFERLAACCALAALLSPRQGFQLNC